MKFPKEYNLLKLKESITFGWWCDMKFTHRINIYIRGQGKSLGKTFTIQERFMNPKWYNIRILWIIIYFQYRGEFYESKITF